MKNRGISRDRETVLTYENKKGTEFSKLQTLLQICISLSQYGLFGLTAGNTAKFVVGECGEEQVLCKGDCAAKQPPSHEQWGPAVVGRTKTLILSLRIL